MKRKMLISIALLTIMLLNCMMPLFMVYAAEGEGIQLNSTLFYAVVDAIDCVDNGDVAFEVNEGTHTIYISAEELAKVKCLDLAGKGINDLTNLDKFTSLESLVLSSNDLYSGEESNLSVLDNLPNLVHLNLSENHLDSVADIPGTMERLFNSDNGTILLTGQIVNKVVTVDMNTVDKDATVPETVTVEVPEILSLAGDLKSVWKTKEGYTQTDPTLKIEESLLKTLGLPYIDYAKFADLYKVGPDSKSLTVTVADSNGLPYYGMLKYTISIVDEKGEGGLASNLNKASENALYESVFNIYVVVKNSVNEAITMVDENLYYAVKEQLTGGQTVNGELSSYPYVVDMNGNTIYIEYVYTTTTVDGTNYQILTEKDSTTPVYCYDPATARLYTYEDDVVVGELVDDVTLTPATIQIVSETDGSITTRNGYTTPFKSEKTGETMYIAAYDDAYTLLINDDVLTNDITSLVLDGKKIQYLDGLQYFVGLTSDLNLSYNYLKGVEQLSLLQAQKDHWEKQVVENYSELLKTDPDGNLSTVVAEIEAIMQKVESTSGADVAGKIIEILRDASKLVTSDENYETQLQEKANLLSEEFKKLYGYTDTEGKHVNGLIDNLEEDLKAEGSTDTDATSISDLLWEAYAYLSALYREYSNEYKITTLLADNVNYMTYSDYEKYSEAVKTYETAKVLGDEQIAFVTTLESAKALSELDMELLLSVFPGIQKYIDEESETPVADYFAEQEYSHAGYKRILKEFRMIGLYSELANYCLIKRMEVETAPGICYAEEYLERRIEELSLENIPADYEEAMLARLKGEYADLSFFEDDAMMIACFDSVTAAYVDYAARTYEYGEEISITSGEYLPVTDVQFTVENYTAEELENLVIPAESNGDFAQAQAALDLADGISKNVVKQIYLAEEVNGVFGAENDLVVYNQLMSLAKKLLNGNVEKYVQLADLKKLNIAENGHLDNLEGITELQSLVDLNADHCAFSDVESIDWSKLPNLRKLSLSHNGIETMDPFVKLKNLTYLDLSKNNISGKIDIDPNDFSTFFDDLAYLNLSENQISDIRSIQLFLDGITNGNYGEYLANTEDFELDLRKQNITINIEEPILYNPSVKTINVDLTKTKIFTQLKAIDTKRTAFGMNSEYGSINADGTNMLINVSKLGKQTAIADIENIDKNAAVEDYCIGYGSKITVNYTVIAGTVSTFAVNPTENITVNAGETVQFTGEVTGENLFSTKVIYTVKGNTSADTKIDSNGLLTVGADEKSTSITVVAHPEADPTITKSIDVTVVPSEEPTTPPTEGGEGTTPPTEGGEGTNPPAGDGEEVTPPTDGGEDTTVDVVNPGELGYEAGEEFLTGINPKTPVEDFSTIFLNGKEYNVVIKKDGETITSGNMATGMYVQLQDENGEVVKDQNGDLVVYEIIVNGDVNGDGLANSLDSILIKAHRNEITALAGDAFEAADINNDGYVNVADSKLLLYHRAEVKGYDLNYVK